MCKRVNCQIAGIVPCEKTKKERDPFVKRTGFVYKTPLTCERAYIVQTVARQGVVSMTEELLERGPVWSF